MQPGHSETASDGDNGDVTTVNVLLSFRYLHLTLLLVQDLGGVFIRSCGLPNRGSGSK